MDRREFLFAGGSLLLILPAGWSITGCDDDDDNIPTTPAGTNDAGTGTDAGPGATDAGTDTGGATGTLTFTSSVSDGHTHQFSIAMTDLTQPSGNGIIGDTSVTEAHVHVVALSAAELSQINAGQTVSKDTSNADAHLHTFQFSRTCARSQRARPGLCPERAHRQRPSRWPGALGAPGGGELGGEIAQRIAAARRQERLQRGPGAEVADEVRRLPIQPRLEGRGHDLGEW